MYVNNWHWADLRNAGFWDVLAETAVIVFLSQLTLVCWSWTSGFVLGSVSRGMIRTNGVALCLVLLFGELVGAPLCFAFYWQYLQRSSGLPSLPDPNAPVFALTFYRSLFPLIVQAALVVLPSVWGMRQAAGSARFRPVIRALLGAAAIASVASMVIENPDLWLFLKAPRLAWVSQGWLTRLLQIALYWPLGYLIARRIKGRWYDEVGLS
jgi:hypothetical protein